MHFFVDPDRLAASGGTMRAAGVEAAGSFDRLHRDIATGAATPWAADGSLDALYQELSALTGEALDLVTTALEQGGTGVQAMADTYRRVDDAVGEGFDRIAQGLREAP